MEARHPSNYQLAVPVSRYFTRVVDCTQNELDELDRKTRKVMTINHALHQQSDVYRLYMSRNEGGRGLLQLKQTVEEEKRALYDYIQNSTEDALKVVSQEYTEKDYRQEEIKKRRDIIMAEQNTPRSIAQGHRRQSRHREEMELAKKW